MGGYGSGRRNFASPKEVVENCLVLSAAQLQREGVIDTGVYGGGGRVWRRVSTGEQTAAIGYHVNTLDNEISTIRLQYTTKRRGEDQAQKLDYLVGLTTTPLPWGGVRWWFICPLVANGGACGRRVGKLYLPPGGRYFGCRDCHHLTYTSCQESHKFDGLYALLAARTGISPARVKRLLKT